VTATNARVLIVEDEQIIALDLAQMLEELGYGVAGTASRGEDAVALVQSLQPDLILMDIHLAGEIDGVTAARQVRATSDVPVVFVTAFDDAKTVGRAKFTEPYGYLIKPFSQRELRVVIEMALYHHRMQREREELTLQLRGALQEISTLKDLLRMCAYCRRIQDDDGRRQSVETFLQQRTGTTVSHAICPDCLVKLTTGDSGSTDDR
jgi:CheY-like chemotaxis protein